MHLPDKANSLSVQTFMANKSLSDSDSDMNICHDIPMKEIGGKLHTDTKPCLNKLGLLSFELGPLLSFTLGL